MTIAQDLANMAGTLNSLDNKEDGNLVRASDWNMLVGQLEILRGIAVAQQTELARFEDVDTQLTSLEGRIAHVETLIGSDDSGGTILSRLQSVEENKLDEATFNQYQATLDPLLLQYTVTLQTDNSRYLLGEVATLTATVRRLDGSAVTTRPWLDFLVSWGDIQAVSGFDTRPGAGGRSVSVRTDSNGVARVQIKAENLAQTSDSVDTEMQAFLATEISSQGQTKAMRQAVLEAPNPQDGFMRVMYSETTRRYDSGSSGLQKMADMYYQQRFRAPDYDRWFPQGRWNDHRATIAVFAKDDSDPETPDSGKGVSSIQINFRDWVAAWVGEYRPDFPYLEVDPWPELPDILQDPDYRPEIFLDLIDERMTGLGILGKHKMLETLSDKVGQLGPRVNPGAGPLVNVIGDAVAAQKNMDFVVGEAQGGRGLTAMSQALQTAAGTGAVQGKVASMESQVSAIDEKAEDLKSSYGVLNSRMNETTEQGENMMLALGSIDSKVGNINIADGDNVRGSVSAIRADIAALRINLER